MSKEKIVIIGAGQAAIQTADSLRAGGFNGSITVIGEESALPYQRPQLSKDLLNQTGVSVLPLRPENFFENNNIDLRRGRWVTGVDRKAQTIELDSGEILDYTQLVYATGSRPRQLNIPGADSAQVHEIRTVEQALRLREELQPGSKIVIVGGGFIGLEVAAQARNIGAEVTLLPGRKGLMSRSVSPEMSQWFEHMHKQMGTEIRCGETAAAFREADSGRVIIESDAGYAYIADLIVVGIGSIANDELAAESGIEVCDGIKVNSYLQASHQRIWALGDCASFPNPTGEGHIRIESVQNATDQGRMLARNILKTIEGGMLEEYKESPWFWSNQGTARLQIAGMRTECTNSTVTLGDVDAGKFSVLSFNTLGHLCAVESINSPAIHMAARKILNSSAVISADEARAPEFCLKAASKKIAQLVVAA